MIQLLLGFLLLATPSQAKIDLGIGDKIGNGGGLWVCKVRDEMRSAELVDLFEAREEFHWNPQTFLPTDNYRKIYNEKSQWIFSNVRWLHDQIDFFLRHVDDKKSFVNARLRPIEDNLHRLLPREDSCTGGVWSYEQFANFTNYGGLLIDRALWESEAVPASSKAGLLIHEAVYFWLRLQFKATNSSEARMIVGLLFSQENPKVISSKIIEIVRTLDPSFNPRIPGDGVDNSLGFSLNLTSANRFEGILHEAEIGENGRIPTKNFSESCRLEKNSPKNDLLCVLEIEELDLAFNDLEFMLNVPGDMCAYTSYSPYFFMQYEAGKGPTEVSYTTDENGNVVDGAHTQNGMPVCAYNYTEKGGPNCCEGKYNFTSKNMSLVPPEVTTEYGLDWGGDASQCVAGPDENIVKDKNNVPTADIRYTADTGATINYAFRNPISSDMISNVKTSNFIDPIDFINNRPKAFLPVKAGDGKTKINPNLYHTWSCLDRSQELRARIRLMVRDWKSGPIAEDRDPNLGNSDRHSWRYFLDYPGFEM